MTNKFQRLLFVEPNEDNRQIPATEDLAISVELKSITRGRSVISGNGEEGTATNVNTGGGNNGETTRTVGFIDGTNVGGGKRSLTTNYTEINTGFSSGDEENDLEALGIESIDIKFDTAYTPIINIKFIDIRGQAVLQQGNSSKYKMFFQLPYPLFELTVKGFYGKAVTYCLHLTNWNASFNSNTGNFEINADFIGYTYALLTDCIIGYMRAAALTKIGKNIYDEYKVAKDEDGFYKYPNLITIDEFLEYVNTIGNSFKKLSQDSEEIKQLNSITSLSEKIKKLNGGIIKLGRDISREDTIDALDSNLSDVILIPRLARNQEIITLIGKFKSDTQRDWDGDDETDGINEKIEIEELKIKVSEINNIKETNLILENLEETEILSNVLLESENYQNKNITLELAKKIKRNLIIKEKENDTEFVLFDFTNSFSETQRAFEASKARKKVVSLALTDELKKKVGDNKFKPTIKNIIEMLAIHAQIFLKTIREVSINAEGNQERTVILKKRLGYDNMDMKKGSTIYPWPEYKSKRESKGLSDDDDNDSGNDTALYETWIGSRLNELEYTSVPEIEFVEELLEKLMKIAKEDEKRLQGGYGKTPNFFPVSPIDAPISFTEGDDDEDTESLITHNPYYKAIVEDNGENQKTTPYEAYRCLLMRAFNGIGLANRTIGAEQITIMGKLEADNLWNVIVSELEKVDRARMINAISNLGGGVASKQRDTIINEWIKGVTNEVINPPNNKEGKLLKKETIEVDGDDVDYYTYTYLPGRKIDKNFDTDRYRTYIPVSGGFNCRKFVDPEPLSGLKNSVELRELSKSLIFVGNGVNSPDGWISTTNIYGPTEADQVAQGVPITNTVAPSIIGTKETLSDGAIYLKIIEEDKYREKQVNPAFGDTPLREYLEIVGEKSIIKQSDLISATYEDSDIALDDKLNTHNGQYNTLEINNISYDGTDRFSVDLIRNEWSDSDLLSEKICYKNTNIINKFGQDAGDVICSYYFQDTDTLGEYNGTYLAKKPNPLFDKYTMSSSNNNNTYKVFTDTENTTSSDRYETRPEDYGKQRELLGNVITKNDEAYLPFVEFSVSNDLEESNNHFSLFGSRFYYNQTNIGKAFLFLHCTSWNGVHGNVNFNVPTGVGNGADTFTSSMFDTIDSDGDSFENNDDTFTIKGLFGNSGSFIKAPKLWCAFIGGLLYRYDNTRIQDVGNTTVNGDIIDFGTDLLPWQDENSYTPNTDEYLYEQTTKSVCGISLFFDSGDSFRNDGANPILSEIIYPKVDQVILGLPTQAREEFKRVFIDFVNGDFKTIQKNYELFDSFDDMATYHDDLLNKVKETIIPGPTVPASTQYYGPGSSSTIPAHQSIKDRYSSLTKKDVIDSLTASGSTIGAKRITKAINNYVNISPINNEEWDNNKKYVFDLTMKNIGTANSFITSLLGKSYIIMNNRPDIFRVNDGKDDLNPERVPGLTNKYKPIRVDTKRMHLFLDQFFSRFNELSEEYKDESKDENDKYQKQIFNSIDDDTIKLSIYRTLSSIYTKWVGGNVNNKCANIDNIVDSFKFIDSSFFDIGDNFLINPNGVYNKIVSNYNQSFFDVANTILSNNDFNFIPLPTFIDFRNESELKDVFKPYSYNVAVNKEIVGPSFVCVYIGQTSTNLNLGDDSEYEDDGIFIHNDGNGKPTGPLPAIFRDGGNNKALNIPYFLVSYGKDNQSIFKDVKLDQREFTETAESLEIIEDISNSGNKRKPTFNGQNIFNIYQKRSYSAEIEMMGNAMIQPMMYFQLNNIPMFRGAYLINNVSHKITAHNMSTTFKGQRIKNVKTKPIDEAQLFMNLLGPLENAGEADSISETLEGNSGDSSNSDGSSKNNLVSSKTDFAINNNRKVIII